MGCKNRDSLEEENAVSASLRDDLLFFTMCIIGIPVDVLVKDGSIYSGIFHTACVEGGYDIVLKKARLTKKGNCHSNVPKGTLVETLVIQSEDLVQVTAKAVLLPANGINGNNDGDNMGAITGNVLSTEHLESRAKESDSSDSLANLEHASENGTSCKFEDGYAHSSSPVSGKELESPQEHQSESSDDAEFAKVHDEETMAVSASGSLMEDSKQGCFCHIETLEFQRHNAVNADQSSSPSSDDCETQNIVEKSIPDTDLKESPRDVSSDMSTPTLVNLGHQIWGRQVFDETQGSKPFSSGDSTAENPVLDLMPASFLNSSSASINLLHSKKFACNAKLKESKLNPGAKIFSPSVTHRRSETPPLVPSVAGLSFIPEPCPLLPISTVQQEFGMNSLPNRCSIPVKFVPCGNFVVGNGGADVQHAQPIVGHVGSRVQPIRYAGQLHNLPSGSAYMCPNSSNVTVGRVPPFIYVHPVSHDLIHNAAGLPEVSMCSLLTPHQGNLPKHQGIGTTQTLQIPMTTTPFVAGGQQPYPMPSQLPISQPPFPIFRPIPVPVANGFFSSKLA